MQQVVARLGEVPAPQICRTVDVAGFDEVDHPVVCFEPSTAGLRMRGAAGIGFDMLPVRPLDDALDHSRQYVQRPVSGELDEQGMEAGMRADRALRLVDES